MSWRRHLGLFLPEPSLVHPRSPASRFSPSNLGEHGQGHAGPGADREAKGRMA